MTITDRHLIDLDARQTTSTVLAVIMSGALFVPGQAAANGMQAVPDHRYFLRGVESSSATVDLGVDVEITNDQLAAALVELHNNLLESQTVLDAEAEKILSSNLWDMYV